MKKIDKLKTETKVERGKRSVCSVLLGLLFGKDNSRRTREIGKLPLNDSDKFINNIGYLTDRIPAPRSQAPCLVGEDIHMIWVDSIPDGLPCVSTVFRCKRTGKDLFELNIPNFNRIDEVKITGLSDTEIVDKLKTHHKQKPNSCAAAGRLRCIVG